ncbi:hypothetical protein STIAU_5194 [Stigmatella aurantiaca DW4/3-1]|uniref:Uncharacterized protein n=1 Tax=Stigmatella aurantiaca (strain DW4/3-1) TaxID=378806 RepID=Q08QR3_STIAD|nr:hypothetical protein STIAU_5194 [Stigmatella aurantiaca DW4/3-1]
MKRQVAQESNAQAQRAPGSRTCHRSELPPAPATSTWTAAGTLSAPIAAHVAIRLHTGQVLVTGGTFSGMNVTTVQRYSR